jgi:small subunit ribosomal protein S20
MSPVTRDRNVIPLTVVRALSRFKGDGLRRPDPVTWSAQNVAAAHKIAYYARSFRNRINRRTFHSMANSAQARKRARQAEATRKRNATMKSTLRTAVKSVKKAIVAGDKAAAVKTMQISQGIIDRVADKKIVHKNLASRTKSRLAQAIKAMS